MGKSMRTAKRHLAEMGIKPTNRNARMVLHRSRKLVRLLKYEAKRVDSLIPRYELPYYSEEENND